MSKTLTCAPNPCSTCPYRRDVAPGIWDAHEYRKLPPYDDPMNFGGVFLCHNGDAATTVCRGWLEVHENNMGVRIAMFRIEWTPTLRRPTKVPLYPSGSAACAAGLKGIRKPSVKTRAEIQKIVRERATRARSEER